MSQQERVTLADVKKLLSQFAASRAGRPPKDVEAEYGDLLLYLTRLAEKSGVDLITSATRQVDQRSQAMPRPAGKYR